jgi:hypothetical protein
MAATDYTGTGFVRAAASVAGQTAPVSEVLVKLYLENETFPTFEGTTDDMFAKQALKIHITQSIATARQSPAPA